MNNQTKQPAYDRAQFHLLIEQNHRLFKRDALIEAHSLAQAEVEQGVVQNHAKGIQAKYASLLAKIKSQIQGATEKAYGQLDQNHADIEIVKNLEQLSRLKEELRKDEADKRKIHISYDWSYYRWRVALEILILGGEISYNTLGFTVMGGSLLFAILPAIVFAVALGLAAYFIPRYIKSLPERADRMRTGFALGALMFAVFLGIGILRSIAALGSGSFHSLGSGSVIAGTLIFTLLNSFMFFAAMILAWGLPSKEDRIAKETHDKLEKRIAWLKQEINRLESENRTIATTVNHSKRARIQTVGEEAHFENLIKQYSEETIHAFFSEFNIKKPKGTSYLLNSPNNLLTNE